MCFIVLYSCPMLHAQSSLWCMYLLFLLLSQATCLIVICGVCLLYLLLSHATFDGDLWCVNYTYSCPMLYVWQCFEVCVYCTYSCPMLMFDSDLWCVFIILTLVPCSVWQCFEVCLLYLLLSHATFDCVLRCVFIVLTLVPCYMFDSVLWCVFIVLSLVPCIRNSSANFVNQTSDVCKVYYYVRNCSCSPEEHA